MPNLPFLRSFFVLLAGLAVPSLAFAMDPPDLPTAPATAQAERHTSITFSPLHLVLPMLEVTGERDLGNRISASGILGMGKSSGVTLYELGAQAAFRVLGDFDDCIKLGGELLWVGGSASAGSVSATATGLAFGPMVGFKTTADFGLTGELDGGVDFFAARSEAHSGSMSATATAQKVGPLLNIQVGWSF